MAEVDRRPIASRNTAWAKLGAARLVRAGITPNTISQASIVFAAVGCGALLATTAPSLQGVPVVRCLLYVLAAVCMQVRLVCNLLDGMVAVEGGKATRTGEVWNELPDRVSDTLFLVGAGNSCGALWGLLLGATAALFAMATAYVRLLGASAGVGQDFAGPMAKQHRMALLTAACAACAALVSTNYPAYVMGSVLTLIAVGSLYTAVRRTRRVLRKLSLT